MLRIIYFSKTIVLLQLGFIDFVTRHIKEIREKMCK